MPEMHAHKIMWNIIEASLEAKLPTISTDGKSITATEKIRDGESQKREDAGARRGREVAKQCVFKCFVAPEGG